MELKYIWTGEFRNLRDLDLNFSHNGKHQFEFRDENLRTFTNQESVLDFGDSISSITAIAGPNGAGKSTICELILGIMCSRAQSKITTLEFKGILCADNYVFIHKDLILENEAFLEKEGYQIIKFDRFPLENLSEEIAEEFQEYGGIYYSNVLDFRGTMDFANIFNYSQGWLVHYDYENSTLYNPRQLMKSGIPDLLKAHFYEERNRIARLYFSSIEDLPFAPPNEFIIETTNFRNNFIYGTSRFHDTRFKHNIENIEYMVLSHLISDSANLVPEKEITFNIEALRKVCLRYYQLNLILAVSYMHRLKVDFPFIKDFIFSSNWEDLQHFFERFDLDRENIALIGNLVRNYKKIVDVAKFTSLHRQLPKSKDELFKTFFQAIEKFYVKNTSENVKLLANISKLENKLLNIDFTNRRKITNFGFSSQNSTGEYNFYTLFARLQEALTRSQGPDHKWNNILIVLDEADTGFHPVWKKKLLKWLLEFLGKLGSDFTKVKFQLVFTTHSPFLISDLSSENLIFLDNGSGDTKVLQSENRYTFGANINELLSDSFFMSDGLIGDFAKGEIQKIIDQLNMWLRSKENKEEDQIQDSDRDKCFNIINRIGDNIVRNKLLEMFWDVFGDDTNLEDEIKQFESHIKYLKSKRKK